VVVGRAEFEKDGSCPLLADGKGLVEEDPGFFLILASFFLGASGDDSEGWCFLAPSPTRVALLGTGSAGGVGGGLGDGAVTIGSV